MPDYNVKTTATPIQSPTSNGTRTPIANQTTELQTRTSTIKGPTVWNQDTGLVEPVKGGWTGKDGEASPEPKPAPKEGETPPVDRHTAWKAIQAETKKEREAKKTAKVAETQALARDFLKKGDLAGAAKALGMQPAEFREYAQNVLLTVPTPDAEMTPEQRKEADEKKFREDRLAHEANVNAFQLDVIRTNYTRDKIAPVLADKAKYEFISQEEPGAIERYIYDFMDGHYRKTKEELSVADVADVVEAQLEKAFVANVEKRKSLKKVAKLFAAPEAEDPVEEAPAREEYAPRDGRSPQWVPPPVEEELNEPPPARVPTKVTRPRTNGTPFAFLSREEKMRIIDEENRANENRANRQ